MGFVTDTVTLEQIFLRVLQFLPVTVILPMFCISSF